jgi:hypothetical protein
MAPDNLRAQSPFGRRPGRGEFTMWKLLCRVVGHQLKTTNGKHRVCLRCGQKEALRRYGRSLAWEQVTDTELGGTAA